jgi:hypothetical protein
VARDHARIQTSRNRDEDWRALPWEAQWAYDQILCQEALTYAGVLDYRPGRLAAIASNATPRRVETAIAKLEAARFVVIDRDTEELLARSYVRHDGVMDRANMGKAVGRALAKVVSLDLHRVVIEELARHHRAFPSLAGWHGLGDLYPDVMARVTAMASAMALPIESREE